MRVLLGFEVLSVGWKWGEVPDERGGDAPPCQRLLVGNRCVEAGPVSLSVWQPAHCFKASADQGIPRAARRCRPPCRCLYVTHEPSHWERITRAHGSASCSLRLPQRPPPPHHQAPCSASASPGASRAARALSSESLPAPLQSLT